MNKIDIMLDEAIKMHANFHTNKPGLSDKDFKETIQSLIKLAKLDNFVIEVIDKYRLDIPYDYETNLSECCGAPITEAGEYCTQCKEHC